MPELYFFLVCVVALFITALWTRETSPPAGKPRNTARPIGWGVADAPVVECCNHDRAPLRSSALQPEHDRRPFQDLRATLSATYAAKLQQALRTIQVGPPAGTPPTDQVAG
jgi:hypothetical protein